MTQFAMGVAALNQYSAFSAAYEKGIKKSEYWTYALTDALDLIAKLPAVAARIFSNVYQDGKPLPSLDKKLDLIGEYRSVDSNVDKQLLPRKLLKYARFE